MFSPEQLVVYPAQSVGVVERIEKQSVGGFEIELYIVRILDNNITLMVPVKNASNVGLRTLSSSEECDLIFESLKDRSTFKGYTGQNWNRRYREYSERIKSGTLSDTSSILKELLLISRIKDLSFGEKRLLEQAMSLVSMEIACVKGLRQEDVQQKIEDLFEDVLKAREETSPVLIGKT